MKPVCALCGFRFSGFGNNGFPVVDGRVCDVCNSTAVIPARIANLFGNRQTNQPKGDHK